MAPEDMFFTHTIVGSALSIPLGEAPHRHDSSVQGLHVHMRNGGTSLTRVWRDWLVIQGAYPYPGRPRRRPGDTRRWVERHALLIAVLGLFALLASAALLVLPFKFI
jgi:hypothetical protein